MKTTNTLSLTSAIVDLVLIALLAFGLAKGIASPGLSVMIIAGIAPHRFALHRDAHKGQHRDK